MPAHELVEQLAHEQSQKALSATTPAPLQNKLLAISQQGLHSSGSSSTSLNSLSLTSTNDSIITEPESPHTEQLSPSISNTHRHSISGNLTDFLIKNRLNPQTSSILKPGSVFIGSQQSGRSTYEVEVELKYVDLSRSYMCGYLKIQGLTESHPEIITFFEGDMVSDLHSFYTDDKTWGSNDDIDIQHWSKFVNWKNQLPVKKILDKSYVHKNYLSHRNIYMRWKEKFLVPDAQIDNIEGASFAGFYYISFDQVTGDVSGLYYHRSSEKFQQLELCHVPSNGMLPSYQFQ